jgi:uncharacterized membrane protein
MLPSRRRAGAILIGAFLAFPPLALAVPGRYTVTPVPGLDFGAYRNSGAVRINSLGQVAGFYEAEGTNTYFIYDGASTRLLPGVWADSHVTMGFNDRGEFVGSSWYEGGGSRSLLYRNGQIEYLPYTGADAVLATSINNAGQISVYAYSPAYRSGIYQNGKTTWLGTPPGSDFLIAESINKHGQLTGGYGVLLGDSNAFLSRDGQVVDLGVSGFLAYGRDINDAGEVVGSYWPASGGYLPFIYQDGKASLLPTIGSYGEAFAINNHGSAVGITGLYEAALWEDGQVYLLSGLIDGAAWQVLEVRDINDAGQIAGTACREQACQAVIFNPVSAVPETPGWAMLGAGLLALLPLPGLRRRRRNPSAEDRRSTS